MSANNLPAFLLHQDYELGDPELRQSRAPSAEEMESKVKPRVMAHCVIYAKTDDVMMGRAPKIALVMCMFRHDAQFGFFGGLIDPGESVLQGLNREMSEEIDLDLKRFQATEKDFVCVHSNKSHARWGSSEFHCYAKEVSEKDYLEIESNAFKAKEFGQEVNGLIRVPLMNDERLRGLPMFLNHRFSGVAKTQLLYVLWKKNLLTEEQIQKSVERSKTI